MRGLAHLHAHSVIHRDVKPANLLLDRAHVARIGDFGVARALGHGASGTTVTHMQTTNAAGTTLYMGAQQGTAPAGARTRERATPCTGRARPRRARAAPISASPQPASPLAL